MNAVADVEERSEVRDGMRITWHQPIPADRSTPFKSVRRIRKQALF